jgi:hypothetical protein
MKTILSTGLIVIFLVLCSDGIYVQFTKSNFDQIELMKQWVGSWRTEGTYLTSEIRPFGIGGLEGSQKTQFRDSIAAEYRFLWGYDKKYDKYLAASISKNSSGVTLFAFGFISEKTCVRIPFEFIDNPEKATSKAIYEFKSKDVIIGTFTEKNKPDRTYRILRENNKVKQ